MSKQHFFFKLIPPRPTFAMDLDDRERALMQQHGQYVREHFNAGRVLIFGPVMAPAGSFGFAVLEVTDEAEARSFGENDPTVLAKLNRFEIYPMRLGAAQGSAS